VTVSLVQNGLASANGLQNENGTNTTSFSYSWSDPANSQDLYIFNQDAYTNLLNITLCQITNPESLSCSPFSSLALTRQIENLAAGNFFSKLVFTLCFVGADET